MSRQFLPARVFSSQLVAVVVITITCMPALGQSIEMTRGTMLAPVNSQASFTSPANQPPQYVASRDAQYTPGAQQQTPRAQQQTPRAQYQPAQYQPAQYQPAQYQPAQYQPAQYSAAQYQPAQYPVPQYPTPQYPVAQQLNGAAVFNVPYLTGHSSLPQQYPNPAMSPPPQMMGMPNNPYGQQVMQQQVMQQQQLMQQHAMQQQMLVAQQGQPILQQPTYSTGQVVPTHNPQPVPALASPTYGGMLNTYVGQLLQNDCMGGPGGYGNGCGPCGYNSCGVQGCFPRARGNWFGYAGTVLMTRDRSRNIRLSYDSDTPAGSVLSTRDANADYQFGVEARFGRQIGCGPWAWEVGYWSILADQNEHTVNTSEFAGMLNSNIDFGDLDFTEGGLTANVNLWYNDSEIHQVVRRFQVHQVELNFLRLNEPNCAPRGYGNCGTSGWNTNWTFGVRYMKIDENFSFNTDDENDTFGDLTGEVFYSIDLQNHLIGFQLGGQSQYQITRCLSADIDLKAGLYGNHINHRSIVLGCQVGPAVVNGGPHVGEFADVTSRKDDLSFATELRIGLKYQLGCNVHLTGGYRAFAATSVALPEDQIPLAFGDLTSLEYVDSSGGILLHGFLFGLEWRR